MEFLYPYHIQTLVEVHILARYLKNHESRGGGTSKHGKVVLELTSPLTVSG